jgi:hypothetical protein
VSRSSVQTIASVPVMSPLRAGQADRLEVVPLEAAGDEDQAVAEDRRRIGFIVTPLLSQTMLPFSRS